MTDGFDLDSFIGEFAGVLAVKHGPRVSPMVRLVEGAFARARRDADVRDRRERVEARPLGLVDDRAGSRVILPRGFRDG